MAGKPLFRRAYFDSSVWVDALQGGDSDRARLAAHLVDCLDSGLIEQVVLSTVTWLEVLGGNRIDRTDESEKKAGLALQRSNIIWVSVDPIIAVAARRIRLERHVETPDAIHLATARHAEAEIFLTNDDKLVERCSDWDRPSVALPYWLKDPTMF
jgi:predicted nucleic acid-binding protein